MGFARAGQVHADAPRPFPDALMTSGRPRASMAAMSAILPMPLDEPDEPRSGPGRPFTLHAPARQTAPLVFASPHSGRDYPAAFVAESRLGPRALRRSEDGYVDELFASVPAHGAPLLAANFPRAWCDVNREPWELDPAMFAEPLPDWVNTTSPRVGAGLGTIARIVASGEFIYARKLAFAEAGARIAGCWEPYHAALRGLIEATVGVHGACLLIDCHSMPRDAAPGRRQRADFVLGDAHGTSCAPGATRAVETLLAGHGFAVRRNDPYAGGYVTRHYGRPRERVHALQIEVARGLYMDEERMEKRPEFAALQAVMERLAACLAAAGPALFA